LHFGCRSLATAFTLLSSAVSSPFTASAQQYDDPAIAICEFVKLNEKMRDPSYQRLSGDIHNQTASIIYQMSVLNLPPTTQIVECRYQLADGRYEFDFAQTEMEKACVDARNGGRELAMQLDLGPDEMIIITLMCEPHFEEMASKESGLAPLLDQLRRAGVYPMSVGSTALGRD